MSAPPGSRRIVKPRLKPLSKASPKPMFVKHAGKPIRVELIGVGLIAFGIILLLATRLPGWLPGYLLLGAQWLFGIYGAWGIALALIALGVYLLVRLTHHGLTFSALGMGLFFAVAISMLELGFGTAWNMHSLAHEPGGLLGTLIADSLFRLMGETSWVVLIAFGLIGIALLTQLSLWVVLTFPFLAGYRAVVAMMRAHAAAAQARRTARAAELKEAELQSRNRPPAPRSHEMFVPPVVAEAPAPAVEKPARFTAPAFIAPPVIGVPSKENPEQLQFDDDMLSPPESLRPYKLPPIDLLNVTPKKVDMSKDDTNEKIAILEETLRSFGIDAKVVGVERGPRVTRFEIVPPPGVRINRITNLADNLALSLAALDVRVEAPVPGKGVVGIEVPNKESVIVDVREIIESDVCKKSKSPLTFTLGRDIAGHPRVTDLSRMPHLLIAGATNSGKSVCINSLICSILMRATPEQVKFLLVDPKRVELSLFQSIPHLIAPVAYDAKHAAGLLRWAIREMEQRYEMFADKGVRNIAGFNEQSRMEHLEDLPYIVIIIDELADLMMQAAAEFEASICRIAQLARATGIHLVVATQRPSVNVITGTIKANIPSRIAFAVASQVDSRTILDMNGAERLVGQGDMLFLPVDASKPVRIQGAYVTEVEINRVVNHVREQGKPHFSDEIVAIEEEAMKSESDMDGDVSNEPEDEFFDKALDYVRTTKYASTSMLQRKFRIGYTRAARLMDIFEERGYVGPGQGSKPREVIFAPSSSVVGRPTERSANVGIEGESIVDEEL